MLTSGALKKKFEEAFDKKQATVLTEVITASYNDLVKTGDFNELKEIVRDIGIKVGELAEAQKGSEKRLTRIETVVEELAEAQKRTEVSVADLSEEVRILAKGLNETRGEVGGLSKSMSYAFENEAYRKLPGILKEKYGIEIKKKIIRADIGGKEINLFGRAEKDGKDIFIVGESKLRLDERRERKTIERDVFEELDEKMKAVLDEYGKKEIIRVLVTHYATKGFLRKAKDKGVIVVQSFEW